MHANLHAALDNFDQVSIYSPCFALIFLNILYLFINLLLPYRISWTSAVVSRSLRRSSSLCATSMLVWQREESLAHRVGTESIPLTLET